MEISTLPITPDGRLNRQNAARYLGIAAKTLANAAYRGLGPRVVKVGGRCFYFLKDLDAFILSGGRLA